MINVPSPPIPTCSTNITQVISGATLSNIVVNTAGTATLSGANTFNAGVTLTAGALNLNNTKAVGAAAGTFTINGGASDTTNATAGLTGNNNAQKWGGDFTFKGTFSFNLGTGTVDLNAGTRTVTTTANALTVGGVISNGGLTKSGAGTLALSGANTYSGGTAVNQGVLSFLNTAAQPGTGTTTVAAAATLGLGVSTAGGFFTAANVDTLFANALPNVSMAATALVGIDTTAGDFTYGSNVPSTTRGLSKLGANTLALSGNSAYTGPTILTAGALSVGVSGNLSAAASNLALTAAHCRSQA